MNLGQLTTRLRATLGNLDPAQVTDTELHGVINEAYEHLLDRYPHATNRVWFEFMTSTTTGAYALPTYAGAIRHVWNLSTRQKLTQLYDAELQELEGAPAGAPAGWYHSGGMLHLYPRPNSLQRIGVHVKVTNAPMDDDNDEPMLDTTWHPGILRRAAYEWHDHYRPDETKARKALLSWTEWIGTKPAQVQEEGQSKRIEVPALVEDYISRHRYPRRFDTNVWGY